MGWMHETGQGLSDAARDISLMAPPRSVRPDTLRCTRCRKWKEDACFYLQRRCAYRRDRGHYCLQCLGVSAFDHPRPSSMQGRQQSIFTGRPASNPPVIVPDRPPAYWTRAYLGDEK